MKHFRFPDIGQFRQAIRAVKMKTYTIGVDANGDNIYDGNIILPKIKYRGTVKLHGTNSAISMDLTTNQISIQSRENIISVEKDNYGFARFVSGININQLFERMIGVDLHPITDAAKDASDEEKSAIIIYGEWCGGNIQENVAISGMDKMFVVFAVRYKGCWLPEEHLQKIKLPESRIFNILDYPSYEVEIDFEHPDLVQNKLVETTNSVEKECPFGKSFGVSGIGEGVVYRPIDLVSWKESSFWFKVKGKEHSVTKTKQLATIDIEKTNSIGEFIEKAVTENRLKQGISVLKLSMGIEEFDKSYIGDLIRWTFDDIIKEESDTMQASGLSSKDVGQAVAKKTREWFLKNIK